MKDFFIEIFKAISTGIGEELGAKLMIFFFASIKKLKIKKKKDKRRGK